MLKHKKKLSITNVESIGKKTLKCHFEASDEGIWPRKKCRYNVRSKESYQHGSELFETQLL